MITIFTLLEGYWCSNIIQPGNKQLTTSCGSGNKVIVYDRTSPYNIGCCMNYKTSDPGVGYGIWCASFSDTIISPSLYIGYFYGSSTTQRKNWWCNKFYQRIPPRTPQRTPKATLISRSIKREIINPLIFILSLALQ